MSGSYSSCINAALYPSNSDSPFPWTPATVILDFCESGDLGSLTEAGTRTLRHQDLSVSAAGGLI